DCVVREIEPATGTVAKVEMDRGTGIGLGPLRYVDRSLALARPILPAPFVPVGHSAGTVRVGVHVDDRRFSALMRGLRQGRSFGLPSHALPPAVLIAAT